MCKYFIILLTAVSLFPLAGAMSESAASRNRSILPAPTPTPEDNSESLLYLDKREVLIPCPPGYIGYVTDRECPEDNRVINVTARRINVDEKRNSYKYTVSGGSVLDEGQNVRWDLTGARPGTYTIKVAITDGVKTKEATETIRVSESDCGGHCDCPTISVTGNRRVKVDEIANFTADVSGGTGGADITYNWTVSQGEIVSGQGTPTINVKITGKIKETVEATVEIGGTGICAECVKTASATAQIIK